MDVRGVAPLLSVYDMPASIQFYRDGLGFHIAESSPVLPEGYSHWVLLRLGEAELMLNTAFESNDERPPERDPAVTAVHGDTVLYFGCPDVDGACKEFRDNGLQVNEPTIAWYGMKQLSLHDPDGYQICFQWRAEA